MPFKRFSFKQMLDSVIPKSACTENVLYKYATLLKIIRDDSCSL